jgi:hypothetical protein
MCLIVASMFPLVLPGWAPTREESKASRLHFLFALILALRPDVWSILGFLPGSCVSSLCAAVFLGTRVCRKSGNILRGMGSFEVQTSMHEPAVALGWFPLSKQRTCIG